MDVGAGVPPAAGVAGFESEAFSPFVAAGAARVAEVAGESCDSWFSFDSLVSSTSILTGDSSLAGVGSRISFNLSALTVRVMMRPPLPPVDLRRTPIVDDISINVVLSDGWDSQA